MEAMVPLVRVTSVSGSFAAQVLAARLRDEGIDAELRGALGSPYAFTVGDLARIDVYVPQDQADDAQLVLLANEVEDATDLGRETPRVRSVWPLVVALVVLAGAAIAPVARLLD